MKFEQLSQILNEVKEFLTYSHNTAVDMRSEEGINSFNISIKVFGKKEIPFIQEPELKISGKELILTKGSTKSIFPIEDIESIKVRFYKIGKKKKEVLYNVEHCNVDVLTDTEKTSLHIVNRADWIRILQELLDRVSQDHLFAKIYMRNGDIYVIAFEEFAYRNKCFDTYFQGETVIGRECSEWFLKTDIRYKDDFVVFENLLIYDKKSSTYLRENTVYVLESEITRVQGMLINDFVGRTYYKSKYEEYAKQEKQREQQKRKDYDDYDDDY